MIQQQHLVKTLRVRLAKTLTLNPFSSLPLRSKAIGPQPERETESEGEERQSCAREVTLGPTCPTTMTGRQWGTERRQQGGSGRRLSADGDDEEGGGEAMRRGAGASAAGGDRAERRA